MFWYEDQMRNGYYLHVKVMEHPRIHQTIQAVILDYIAVATVKKEKLASPKKLGLWPLGSSVS